MLILEHAKYPEKCKKKSVAKEKQSNREEIVISMISSNIATYYCH
jgi:hypothetical protein